MIEPGRCTSRLCFKKDVYDVNKPITHRPEYLAIREPGDILIQMLFLIDQAKSVFEKGLIVPQGVPIKVSIPLRRENEIPTNHTIWYTSFRILLTHSTTDEFTIETSKPITHVIMLQMKEYCATDFTVNILAIASSSTTRKA